MPGSGVALTPEQLQVAIEQRGLGVAQAARVLGVTPAELEQLLSGERAMPHHRAVTLRLALAHHDAMTAAA